MGGAVNRPHWCFGPGSNEFTATGLFPGFHPRHLIGRRGFAHQHPGLYAAGQIAPDPDAEGGLELAQSAADAVALMGAVLRGFGLPDARTVDAVRTARSALHGFVMLEASGGFGMPDSVDRSFEALLDTVVAGILELARA